MSDLGAAFLALPRITPIGATGGAPTDAWCVPAPLALPNGYSGAGRRACPSRRSRKEANA